MVQIGLFSTAIDIKEKKIVKVICLFSLSYKMFKTKLSETMAARCLQDICTVTTGYVRMEYKQHQLYGLGCTSSALWC